MPTSPTRCGAFNHWPIPGRGPPSRIRRDASLDCTLLKTCNDPETRLEIADGQWNHFFVRASLACPRLHALNRTQGRIRRDASTVTATDTPASMPVASEYRGHGTSIAITEHLITAHLSIVPVITARPPGYRDLCTFAVSARIAATQARPIWPVTHW
jgi:hypothetical protein